MFIDKFKLQLIVEGTVILVAFWLQGRVCECNVGVGEHDLYLPIIVSVEEAGAFKTDRVGLDGLDDFGGDILEQRSECSLHVSIVYMTIKKLLEFFTIPNENHASSEPIFFRSHTGLAVLRRVLFWTILGDYLYLVLCYFNRSIIM